MYNPRTKARRLALATIGKMRRNEGVVEVAAKTSWEDRKAAIRAKAQKSYEAKRDALTAKDFAFCIECERVWYRKPGKGWCPGAGCHGSEFDLWPWTQVRDANPGYPEVPQPGDTYPMYGQPEKPEE